MEEKKLLPLLRTGNFTIVYWDNQSPTLYKGKWDIEEEFEKDDYEEMEKHRIDVDYTDTYGYLPDIVALLVHALKGHADSI